MPAIITSLMFIVMFLCLYFLGRATHNSEALQNKSYAAGGGAFLFAMLGVFPEIFVLIGAILFLLAYFEFFHIRKPFAEMCLAFTLACIYHIAGAQFLFIFLLPELFDLSAFTYAKYKKREPKIVFGSIITRTETANYNCLNVSMLFLSLCITDPTIYPIIFGLCMLITWYFYNKLKRA